ncbi:signal protein [Actinokineospora xionganensis]|uniref:Signal protein n=1 Tax=Actinokineospora xionganensis TaxID=2684470 RepID=A0ABR7L2T0_9PSEU|nr:signal protein [Actinokineospora xionganensis]MBC6446647.1 signal protein [Actinokineospora xionganensis]
MRRTIVLAALLAAGCGTTGPAEPPPPSPTGERGSALDEAAIQTAWWTWAAGSPPATNPVMDLTGEDCAVDQPATGPWFLAGTFGETATRRCAAPAGRMLVAPVVNRVARDATGCRVFLSGASGAVAVDGETQTLLRWSGSDITVRGVADNPVSDKAGRFSGRACGLWVAIAPLPPGDHTITIRGDAGTLSVSVDYHLTVSPADPSAA